MFWTHFGICLFKRLLVSTLPIHPCSVDKIINAMKQFILDIEPFFYLRPVTYVDVGAYRGETFAALVASSLAIWEAHLIEPNPESFAALQKAAQSAKSVKQVRCYNLALGSQRGTLLLHAAGTMTKVVVGGQDDPEVGGRFEIKSSTLDTLAADLTAGHISILKIDVEGFEEEVLKGAQTLLGAHSVDVVYIEAGIDPNGTQQCYYRNIEDTLAKHRYRLFRIYEQHNEWLEDSPLLRRVNLAFMSETFAARNPYRLSRELFDLRKENGEVKTDLAQARLSVASAEGERAELMKKLVAAEQAHVREAGTLRADLAALDQRLVASEREREALTGQLVAAEQAHVREAGTLRTDLAARRPAPCRVGTRARGFDRAAGRCRAGACAGSGHAPGGPGRARPAPSRVGTRARGFDRAAGAADQEHAREADTLRADLAALDQRLLASEREREALTGQLVAADQEHAREADTATGGPGRARPAPSRVGMRTHKAAVERFVTAERTHAARVRELERQQAQKDELLRSANVEAKSAKDALLRQKASMECDLSTAKAALERAKAAAKAERAKSAAAVTRVKGHLSYRLGAELIAGSRSVWGTLRLPLALCTAYRSFHKDLAERTQEHENIDLITSGRISSENELRPSSNSTDSRLSAPVEAAVLDSSAGSAHSIAQAARGGLRVKDLVTKLWGGFSDAAYADLKRLLKEPTVATSSRVLAAWHLARREAAGQNWDRCLSHLIAISKLDKTFFRAKRTRLLLIEAYAKNGNPEKAINYAERALEKESDGNYHCGIVNALLTKGGMPGGLSANLGRNRLAGLNRIYETAGLARLSLIDPARGLEFGNLMVEAPSPAQIDGPKISILVPVYNASGFVETAIGSLFAQSWSNIEIVAVDDASTDDSWEKLQRLAAQNARLRIFRNEANLGAYPTRNRALECATGDLVTVHDSDDWSHPQMLAVQAKALLRAPDVKGTFSAMARVSPDMEFMLRPERDNLEYVHRSYPSLMMRRADLALLDRWDAVLANADDELVQRARAAWGDTALLDVLPTTPLSFFLRHGHSLTEQKGTHLKSLTFGIRHEYAKQAAFWRTAVNAGKLAIGASMARTDPKTPFPIPNGLAPKNWRRNPVYDLVIISDLTLLGGTRRCNEGYIAAATTLGLRVGLFNWPRYDLVLSDIAAEYRRLSYQPNVDILVPEDVVTCGAILIHHPPILKYPIDAIPKITTDRIAILVNQLPMQLRSNPPHYYFPEEVAALCQRLFGRDPYWIPISPLVRRSLKEIGYRRLSETDWFPPLGRVMSEDAASARPDVGTKRQIVIGRHARDHWTKWPGTEAALRGAYCADTDIAVKLMGGVAFPKKRLRRLPDNWQTIDFDRVAVSRFLSEIDFFLHFVNDDYIEEFGRNVMEAMAHGIPAVLPHPFRETFGDGAVYCAPEEVADVVRRLWSDPATYRAQAARGRKYILRTSDQRVVERRLADFVQRKMTAAA